MSFTWLGSYEKAKKKKGLSNFGVTKNTWCKTNKTGDRISRELTMEHSEKKILTTSVLAAAVVIVDVGVHHPEVADVVLAIIPTPVAPEMDPLPANPAGTDKSPTSIRRSLVPQCQPSWPVSRPALFAPYDTRKHFTHFSVRRVCHWKPSV